LLRSFYYITNLLLHVILVSYIQRILIKQAKLRPETLSLLKTKDNNLMGLIKPITLIGKMS